MKKLFTSTALLTVLCGAPAVAQPVISNGNSLPPVGYTDSIAIITSPSTSPGPSGANVSWDFSALSPDTGARMTVVDPTMTPFASQFPTSNFAVRLDLMGGLISAYDYDYVDTMSWEKLGSGITIASGSTYLTNSKTTMPFPFTYQTSIVDTFVKGSNPADTVRITYDAYGTLKTPYGTYNNVIRSKREFGGTDYFYEWYLASPQLLMIANYDNNTGRFTFFNAAPLSVKDVAGGKAQVSIYPHPVTSIATISIGTKESLKGATLVLSDLNGSTVREISIQKSEVSFSREGLNSGLYFYTLANSKGYLAKGMIVIQ